MVFLLEHCMNAITYYLELWLPGPEHPISSTCRAKGEAHLLVTFIWNPNFQINVSVAHKRMSTCIETLEVC